MARIYMKVASQMIKNQFSYDKWLQIRLIRSKEFLNAKIKEHRDSYIRRNMIRSSPYFYDLVKTIQESLIYEIRKIFFELSKEKLLENSVIYDIKKNLLHFVEQFYTDTLNKDYFIVSADLIVKNKYESQKIVFNEIEMLFHNLLTSISGKIIDLKAHEIPHIKMGVINSSKEGNTHEIEQGGGKNMEKNTIQQFINAGSKLKEEYLQHKKDLATSGIADLTGDMPAGMHEWMNSIKIYAKRNLTNHPLYEDINSVLFHNRNGIKDYEKMMGLLKAIFQDMSTSGDSDVDENSSQSLRDTIIRMAVPGNSSRKLKDYDVFISHANADKIDYVNELYLTIKKLGINIFYDSDVLSWGDNWKDTILRGTEQSEFAIIVISESFFGREWTEKELWGFLDRQNNLKQKIILPLLHNITVEQLKERYPSIQYIQCIRSDKYTKEQIAILLAKELIQRYKGNN